MRLPATKRAKAVLDAVPGVGADVLLLGTAFVRLFVNDNGKVDAERVGPRKVHIIEDPEWSEDEGAYKTRVSGVFPVSWEVVDDRESNE